MANGSRTSQMLTDHLVADVVDIEQVAAVLRDQAVDQSDRGPLGNKSASQVGADEAKAAGNQNFLVCVKIQRCFSARTT